LKAAADGLVAQRYMLPEDADRTLKLAQDANIPLP
jgi:hypothetical protein